MLTIPLAIGSCQYNRSREDVDDSWGKGPFFRSRHVDPDLYNLASCSQVPQLANLNDASIALASRDIHEAARLIFCREMQGKLTVSEMHEIEDAARLHAAKLIHMEDSRGIIFGRNTTEVIGLAYYLANVCGGDILASDAENESVYRALRYRRDNGNPIRHDSFAAYPTWYSSRGPQYSIMHERQRENPVTTFAVESTRSDEEIFQSLDVAINVSTKLLVVSHVLRSTGKEVPVKELCALARAMKKEKNPSDPAIFIVIDGTQAVGNLSSIDWREMGADAYAFTTYKTLGSPPIGILAVDAGKESIQQRIENLRQLDSSSETVVLRGMIDRNLGDVSNVDDSLSYADLHAFNVAVAQLSNAAQEGDFQKITEHRCRLRTYFAEKIQELNQEMAQESILYRDTIVAEIDVSRPTAFILDFCIRGEWIEGYETDIWEDLAGNGAFCSCIAFDGAKDQVPVFRVSFGITTTTDDIDRFMTALRAAIRAKVYQSDENRLQRMRTSMIAHLAPNERDWRMHPFDGGNPNVLSEIAMIREVGIRSKVQALLDDTADCFEQRTHRDRAEYIEKAYEELKFFPVLWISAPHIESKVHAAFPGEPTPLLYATAVLDRYLRIDEFPSERRVPKITSVMNPPMYCEQFEQQLIDNLRQYAPRVVGISNIAEGHYFALKIARLVKEHSPSTIVLFGGSHEDTTHPAGYRQAADRAKTGKKRGASSEVFQLEEEALRKMDALRTLADPEERQWIDFVISGDAPFALVEFMKMIADHPGIDATGMQKLLTESREVIAAIPGSGYFSFVDEDAGDIVDLPLSGKPIDRSTLPFIDRRHLTNDNRFPVFDYKKTAQVMASVGCKYACEFCCESADAVLQNVPNLQPREPEHVWKELQMLAEQGYEAIFFDDSTFTQTPSLTHRLLDLMIAHSLGLEWGCQTTINDVDEALLDKMAAAGCTYVYFGFEQASAQEFHVQKSFKTKTISSDASLPILETQHATSQLPWITRFQQVASLCKKNGIRVGTSLQFGLGESDQARKDTIDVIAEMVASGIIPEGSVALNINALYPGTVQWVRAMADSKPLPDYRQKLERDVRFETAHQFGSLRPDEVEKVYQYANSKLGKALLQ